MILADCGRQCIAFDIVRVKRAPVFGPLGTGPAEISEFRVAAVFFRTDEFCFVCEDRCTLRNLTGLATVTGTQSNLFSKPPGHFVGTSDCRRDRRRWPEAGRSGELERLLQVACRVFYHGCVQLRRSFVRESLSVTPCLWVRAHRVALGVVCCLVTSRREWNCERMNVWFRSISHPRTEPGMRILRQPGFGP